MMDIALPAMDGLSLTRKLLLVTHNLKECTAQFLDFGLIFVRH
jgi:CheY-like chemotaxis protein